MSKSKTTKTVPGPGQRLLLAACLALAAPGWSAAAFADVFLSRYAAAQPVIQRTVEAFGGADRLKALTSIRLRTEGTIFQRYQSRLPGPPFDAVEGNENHYLLDLADGRFRGEFLGPVFSNALVIRDGSTYAIDLVRETWTERPNAPDLRAHFIQRIVPPLLALKLYQRSRSVILAGTSTIDGAIHDVLALAWDDGNVYMIHVARATGLISRYDILAPDPVVGDTIAESYFADYREVDGIPFPMRRWQQIGGQMTMDFRTVEVDLSPGLDSKFEVPAGFTELPSPPTPASALREIAKGVYLGNGAYQNLYIDMGEYLISVDAGGGSARVRSDLAELDTLTGSKPLRYAIITHHHSDHTDGADALVAAGATLVSSENNRAHLTALINGRRYLAADTDRLPRPAGGPAYLAIGDDHEFRDGRRRVQVYRLPNVHAEDYYVVYLPREKLLYGADVFGLPANGPAFPVNEMFEGFYAGLQALDLKIDVVANAHGPLGTGEDLRARAEGSDPSLAD
ncbi:MAG: MBL fold metallo-hydrolase [Gammaproteobacteria bacterium]|jgi:glyoxylase-like metal-dependent hydrolase (beta-lactamase superfamily II)